MALIAKNIIIFCNFSDLIIKISLLMKYLKIIHEIMVQIMVTITIILICKPHKYEINPPIQPKNIFCELLHILILFCNTVPIKFIPNNTKLEFIDNQDKNMNFFCSLYQILHKF